MNRLRQVKDLKVGDKFYHPGIPYVIQIDQIEEGPVMQSFSCCPKSGDHIIFLPPSLHYEEMAENAFEGYKAVRQHEYYVDNWVWVISPLEVQMSDLP